MKRILLVRHGETEWNAARRLQGQTDIALNDRGREQARVLATLVRSLVPDAVLTSDLSRAQETAKLLGYPEAQAEPLLREQNLGVWSGAAIADIRATAPQDYLNWRAGTFAPEGGELWLDFRARVTMGLNVALQHAENTALIVCHGGVIRALLDATLGLAPSRIIPVGPGSLTVLAYPQGQPRLEAFNVSGAALELNAPD